MNEEDLLEALDIIDRFSQDILRNKESSINDDLGAQRALRATQRIRTLIQ